MKEIIVNGHKWYFSKELPKVELWYSNWHCSDGDGVSMYVDKINKNADYLCSKFCEYKIPDFNL